MFLIKNVLLLFSMPLLIESRFMVNIEKIIWRTWSLHKIARWNQPNVLVVYGRLSESIYWQTFLFFVCFAVSAFVHIFLIYFFQLSLSLLTINFKFTVFLKVFNYYHKFSAVKHLFLHLLLSQRLKILL